MPLNYLKAFSFIEWLKKDRTEIKLIQFSIKKNKLKIT